MQFDFGLETLVKDMSEFTGLSYDETMVLVDPGRKDNSKTWDEFGFISPQSLSETVFFNRVCRQFFFECALHPPWHELVHIPEDSKVLDYGAGIGTDSLWLYTNSRQPVYFDTNLLESEFFRWRCSKYGFDIPIVAPYCGVRFDYIACVGCEGPYKAVVFRDVLEHIPDYKLVLEGLSELLLPGGYMFIQAPFSESCEIGVHMKERWSIAQWMLENDYTRLTDIIWQKGD